MKSILSLILLCIIFTRPVCAELPEEPHILVTGSSEVRVIPDILNISLNISEVDLGVAEARDSVEYRSSRLIEELRSFGVVSKDINSAELRITPHYNWNNRNQVYVGTEVSRRIEVTLRDLTKYDQLIRSIIDANVAKINNTSLNTTKEKELKAKALQGAVKDARQKAELLVEGFPEKVGGLHSISTSPQQAGLIQSQYRVAEFAAQKSFEPGEITLTESVQVIFYLTK